MDRLRGILAGVLTLHYVANFAHGVAHGGVPVPLTPGQTAFVVLVVTVGPVAGAALFWRGRPVAGGLALAAVLLASFLFGVAFHYVLSTPDHVGAVPAGWWRTPFRWTAAWVALADGIGAFVALALARHAQGSSSNSSIPSMR
ncbi:hypothetical protein OB920_00555 [Halobacteria archaeon HArc-gm2]|nr:hypothetical protein [Halobacteria archaeon HArc-gm2]